MPQLTIDDINRMTLAVGEQWAVSHAKRLLCLVDQIGAGLTYDQKVLELAVYLHDWGAYPKYLQNNVEHALRSRQVIEEEILPCLELTSTQNAALLESIELHDYRDQRLPRSPEALLLREADMLEFLGVIGMAREFARGPRNVDACHKRVLERMEGIKGRFILPRAQDISRVRFERMEQSLIWLTEESFGAL
jgi:uncharacterized protein